jgi:hypothetical protein
MTKSRGIAKPSTRGQFDENVVREAHKKYVEEKLSVDAVAASLNICDLTLKKRFEALGLEIRKSGPTAKLEGVIPVKEMFEFYMLPGNSLEKVSKKFGYSLVTVKKYFVKAGYKSKSNKEHLLHHESKKKPISFDDFKRNEERYQRNMSFKFGSLRESENDNEEEGQRKAN